MPASPISAFKARARKEVKLPHTGLVVEIGILDCLAFVGVGELPIPAEDGPSSAATDPQARLTLNLRYIDRAIAMGAIDPPFSDRPEDKGRADVVHVTELPYADRMYLGQAIIEWAGLSADWAAQVSSFRTDEERPAGAGAGGEVSRAAASGAGQHTG
jgi:hypothetical protein